MVDELELLKEEKRRRELKALQAEKARRSGATQQEENFMGVSDITGIVKKADRMSMGTAKGFYKGMLMPGVGEKLGVDPQFQAEGILEHGSQAIGETLGAGAMVIGGAAGATAKAGAQVLGPSVWAGITKAGDAFKIIGSAPAGFRASATGQALIEFSSAKSIANEATAAVGGGGLLGVYRNEYGDSGNWAGEIAAEVLGSFSSNALKALTFTPAMLTYNYFAKGDMRSKISRNIQMKAAKKLMEESVLKGQYNHRMDMSIIKEAGLELPTGQALGDQGLIDYALRLAQGDPKFHQKITAIVDANNEKMAELTRFPVKPETQFTREELSLANEAIFLDNFSAGNGREFPLSSLFLKDWKNFFTEAPNSHYSYNGFLSLLTEGMKQVGADSPVAFYKAYSTQEGRQKVGEQVRNKIDEYFSLRESEVDRLELDGYDLDMYLDPNNTDLRYTEVINSIVNKPMAGQMSQSKRNQLRSSQRLFNRPENEITLYRGEVSYIEPAFLPSWVGQKIEFDSHTSTSSDANIADDFADGPQSIGMNKANYYKRELPALYSRLIKEYRTKALESGDVSAAAQHMFDKVVDTNIFNRQGDFVDTPQNRLRLSQLHVQLMDYPPETTRGFFDGALYEMEKQLNHQLSQNYKSIVYRIAVDPDKARGYRVGNQENEWTLPAGSQLEITGITQGAGPGGTPSGHLTVDAKLIQTSDWQEYARRHVETRKQNVESVLDAIYDRQILKTKSELNQATGANYGTEAPPNLSAQVYNAVAAAKNDANREASELWNDIPRNYKFMPSQIKPLTTKIQANMRDLQKPTRHDQNKKEVLVYQTFFKNLKEKGHATMDDIIDYRANLAEEIARTDGLSKKRMIQSRKEALDVLKTLDRNSEVGAKFHIANDYQTAIGKLFNDHPALKFINDNSYKGRRRVQPGTFLDDFLNGKQGAIHKPEELIEALTGWRVAKRRGVGTIKNLRDLKAGRLKDNPGAEDAFKQVHKFLLVSLYNSASDINGKLKTDAYVKWQNKYGPTVKKIEQYAKQHGVDLGPISVKNFHRAQIELNTLVGSSKRTIENVEKAAADLFLSRDNTPKELLKKVLGSKNAAARINELTRIVSKNPDAMRGLRQHFQELMDEEFYQAHTFSRTGKEYLNGYRIAEYVNNPENTKILRALGYDDAHLKRLRKLSGAISRAEKVKLDVVRQGEPEDEFNIFDTMTVSSLLSRGYALQREVVGPLWVTSDIGSRYIRAFLGRMGVEALDELIKRAMIDDKVALDLMSLVDVPVPKSEKAQVAILNKYYGNLHTHLWNIGIRPREEGQKNGAPESP